MKEKSEKDKLTLREFLQMNELLGYFFRKKDSHRPAGFSLRSMHFVNKFSMAVFLLAVLYLLIKHWL